MDTNWLKVFIAAFLEIFWVMGLAHADNFWTWSGTIITLVISNFIMISAAQVLPAGTVYAVFVGLGTAGTVLAEILFFEVPFDWRKILLIGLLLAGVIGLKMMTGNNTEKGAEQ